MLDALRFVSDALSTSPEAAVGDRGGIDVLLHRSGESTAQNFSIELDLGLRVDDVRLSASYAFRMGPDPTSKFPSLVQGESWSIDKGGEAPVGTVRDGLPRARLLLSGRAAEDPELAELESALRAMEFYDLNTTSLRALDESTLAQEILGATGAHLGKVLGALSDEDAAGKERLDSYLSALVPGALGIDERREGRYSTVEARFRAERGASAPAEAEVFPRESLSEGTLRAAGVLAALLQRPAYAGTISLIGMEEPETALHPATVGALYEALDDAAAHTQVIVTTQSSALLDNEYVSLDHLRVVESVDGATVVGDVDSSGREIVAQGLMTISQLHASGQMRPGVVADSGLNLTA